MVREVQGGGGTWTRHEGTGSKTCQGHHIITMQRFRLCTYSFFGFCFFFKKLLTFRYENKCESRNLVVIIHWATTSILKDIIRNVSLNYNFINFKPKLRRHVYRVARGEARKAWMHFWRGTGFLISGLGFYLLDNIRNLQ